jgi:Zn-dependent protease with chaperone function
MSFLLMVFLTLVCLPEPDWYPEAPWGDTPGSGLWGVPLLLLVVLLHAWWVERRFSLPVARDPGLRDTLLPRYERGRFTHQTLVFGLYTLVLLLGWGSAARSLCRWNDLVLPGAELLTLAPLLGCMLVSWFFFYDADRAAHRAAQHPLDADPFGHAWTETRPVAAQRSTVSPRGGFEGGDSLPEPPQAFGGRWAYVAFQARQKLALVFIPVLLLIGVKGIGRLFPSAKQVFPLVGFLAVALVVLLMPWLVRLVLGLRSLPAGPLRDRLLAAGTRLRFRCTDILLWNTRSGMANAMVMGLVPWIRYVVFTDRLVEEFTEEEVEAVFGHEVGHIHHQHMLYYLTFLTLSSTVLGVLADNYLVPLFNLVGGYLSGLALPESLSATLVNPRYDLASVPVGALLLGYIFVVFGLLSRRCERQADVFGCRAVSCGLPLCFRHEAKMPLSPVGQELCRTGIRTFIRALEKVAQVNGISRERPGFLQSWQHSTIARRVAFLEQVLADPRVETVFQRRVAVLKWLLLLGLGGLLVVLVGLHGCPW